MILATLLALLAFLTVVPVHAQTGIIVPLYAYPKTSATWKPLQTAIRTYPDVQFYVIVNPDSGPGPTDTNYQAAVATLHGYANVLLVGYVYTSYGARPLDEVKQDIDTYAAWPSASSLAGIFFDETQAGLTSTYKAYTDAARNTTWSGRTTAYVILNPGEDIGNSDYYTFADQIVTFEDTYARYQALASLPLPHPAQQSFIINSFDGTDKTLASVVQALKTSGLASAYITNLVTHIYKSFGSDWTVFVQDVNTET
ncbi:putative cell surface spherulin 4-like protein [Mycena sanguinolenta]|uniref:Putative cell surface spherulin 4-like protein n=1 Tax=Mycena sanguinolenta TaxID=230812 RepID=A0A8H7DP22_9AGAR|nr:putative cell surface spherulin 4-like protein [Mycena sanguinolenta]